MAEILTFPTPAKPKGSPAPPARTPEDDAHDAAVWMSVAEQWGWTALEFTAPDQDLSGLMFLHSAVDDATPLFTLVRHPDQWKLWNRKRDLSVHDTLHSALQAVFPSDLTHPPAVRRR